ncbi:MAG: hypothetical protein KDA61_07265 [Planctomycetales bacterium]|nr:hypothetical protein [Planctomycetales bacterium]
MQFRTIQLTLTAACVWGASVAALHAQQATPHSQGEISLATANLAALPPVGAAQPATSQGEMRASGPSIRFQQVAVQAGDRVEQQTAVRLQLKVQIAQSGQIAHESVSDLGREQRRQIEVLEAEGREVRRARVAFLSSRNQTPENPQPDQLMPQAVHGKSYLVKRKGEQLTVTDVEGAIPPMDEYEIVVDAVQHLGKPHPLAETLLRRPIGVGETLLLPRATAEQLLGLGEQLGDVRRFALTLQRVEPGEGPQASPQAVFVASIETVANERSPMELSLQGEVVVEIATCRALEARFQGPVGMSTTQRTEEGVMQYSAGGEVHVVMENRYATRF